MIKSFFLTYATMLDVEEAASILGSALNIEFEERVSDFIGEYLKGLNNVNFDHLTVKDGLYDKDFLTMVDAIPSKDGSEVSSQYAKTIIEFSFYKGKNKDKERKYEYVKQVLATCTPDRVNPFVLIKDRLITE